MITYRNTDVLANPNLAQIVFKYLNEYEGNYPFLVAMKQLFEEENNLETEHIRKVLNCMRHDFVWADKIPEVARHPGPRVQDPLRNSRGEYLTPCNKHEAKIPHHTHRYGKSYEYLCDGIPWKINRPDTVWARMTVKASHCVSTSGKLIHRVGLDKHYAIFYPEEHAWGWKKYLHQPKLSINLLCRFPSRLTNPILLDEERVVKYMDAQKELGVRDLNWCPHCLVEMANGGLEQDVEE